MKFYCMNPNRFSQLQLQANLCAKFRPWTHHVREEPFTECRHHVLKGTFKECRPIMLQRNPSHASQNTDIMPEGTFTETRPIMFKYRGNLHRIQKSCPLRNLHRMQTHHVTEETFTECRHVREEPFTECRHIMLERNPSQNTDTMSWREPS